MKISGYTTVRNAVQMEYPFEQSIKSMLAFCDEVVVADSSDGTDKTQEVLKKLADNDKKLKVFHVDVPWGAPNHGIYDGKMKAVARSKCTGDYLWQQDADEVAEMGIRAKIENLIDNAAEHMNAAPVVCLPVIEYWGSKDKVRIDVNPWKWRLSKNLPEITHGIPKSLRKVENGLLYAMHGTDGCDYINKKNGNIIVSSNFVTQDVEMLRRNALSDKQAAYQYQTWFNMVSEHLPTVYHFSWFSIEDKIKKFKNFWNASWISLYNDKKPEGWNPFFSDKSLDEVTEKEIEDLAYKLKTETGGWIFHSPWDGSKINHAKIDHLIHPLMKEWCEKHSNGNKK